MFNISLLAKQGWCLLQNPNSLLAKVLKGKYYYSSNFLDSSLKNGALYIERSIWLAKKTLINGLCWKVGSGNNISIHNDAWIPSSLNYRLTSPIRSENLEFVIDLIDPISRV